MSHGEQSRENMRQEARTAGEEEKEGRSDHYATDTWKERERHDMMVTTLSGMQEPGIYGQRNSRVGKGDGMIEGKRKWR